MQESKIRHGIGSKNQGGKCGSQGVEKSGVKEYGKRDGRICIGIGIQTRQKPFSSSCYVRYVGSQQPQLDHLDCPCTTARREQTMSWRVFTLHQSRPSEPFRFSWTSVTCYVCWQSVRRGSIVSKKRVNVVNDKRIKILYHAFRQLDPAAVRACCESPCDCVHKKPSCR